MLHASWYICFWSLELNATISADYIPASGEDPGELCPNEFIAGSVLSLNCVVYGNSGDLTYSWSVMGNPPTPPECTSCDIDASSTTSTLNLRRPLYSYFAGIYTCTVSESGRPDSDNSDDFTVRVVGKRVCILCFVLYNNMVKRYRSFRCWNIWWWTNLWHWASSHSQQWHYSVW